MPDIPEICPDCGKHYDIGDFPFPCAGLGHQPGPFFSGDAQIHTSEAVTVFRNPRTGDTRIPGRADRPMHPKLAAEGYIREELNTHAKIRQVEREKNLIHEASNYDSSSPTAAHDTGSNN